MSIFDKFKTKQQHADQAASSNSSVTLGLYIWDDSWPIETRASAFGNTSVPLKDLVTNLPLLYVQAGDLPIFLATLARPDITSEIIDIIEDHDVADHGEFLGDEEVLTKAIAAARARI